MRESDRFTSSRGALYQYFIEYRLYKGSWDEFNCLRAIATRDGEIINLEANQRGHEWLLTTY
jgi:hypothetical protein